MKSIIQIKDVKDIEYKNNFQLYQLLEDKAYLETAYNTLHNKIDSLKSDVDTKLISYPIPKAIIEEYNKVFK